MVPCNWEWLAQQRQVIHPLGSFPYSCHPTPDPAPRIPPALHSAPRNLCFPPARCGERPELTRDLHVPTWRFSDGAHSPSWWHSRFRLACPVLDASRTKSQHRSMGDRHYFEGLCCNFFFKRKLSPCSSTLLLTKHRYKLPVVKSVLGM